MIGMGSEDPDRSYKDRLRSYLMDYLRLISLTMCFMRCSEDLPEVVSHAHHGSDAQSFVR